MLLPSFVSPRACVRSLLTWTQSSAVFSWLCCSAPETVARPCYASKTDQNASPFENTQKQKQKHEQKEQHGNAKRRFVRSVPQPASKSVWIKCSRLLTQDGGHWLSYPFLEAAHVTGTGSPEVVLNKRNTKNIKMRRLRTTWISIRALFLSLSMPPKYSPFLQLWMPLSSRHLKKASRALVKKKKRINK